MQNVRKMMWEYAQETNTYNPKNYPKPSKTYFLYVGGIRWPLFWAPLFLHITIYIEHMIQ